MKSVDNVRYLMDFLKNPIIQAIKTNSISGGERDENILI